MAGMPALPLVLCALAGTPAGLVAGMSLVVSPVPAQAGPVMVVTLAGTATGFITWLLAVRPRQRRTYRHVRGLCQACGYNLKGNASGVCPECGARSC